jgi:hypothetical protein
MKLKTKKGIGMRSTDAQQVKAYPHQVGTNDLGPTLGQRRSHDDVSDLGRRFHHDHHRDPARRVAARLPHAAPTTPPSTM